MYVSAEWNSETAMSKVSLANSVQGRLATMADSKTQKVF
jgi:hypothetical protein